jgi:hypothetical protein
VLSWLLRFEIRDELARQQHIQVTRGDAQRALAEISASIRQQSPTATLPQVAVANGLPPDLLPELGQYQAIQTALTDKLDGGHPPATAAGEQLLQARFDHYQCLAAKQLAIDVNPQYGQLDYSSYSVVPAPSTLSAAGSPSPSPSTRPQLKPSC